MQLKENPACIALLMYEFVETVFIFSQANLACKKNYSMKLLVFQAIIYYSIKLMNHLLS